MSPLVWSGTCAWQFTIRSHIWAMQGPGWGGQRCGIDGDLTLRTASTSRWAVAILEIISEPPKLVLETLLAEEEGPAVIIQS